MSGTVPILTRGLSVNLEDAATGVHAKGYAISTLCAFVGTLAAGFRMIETFGLPGSIHLAVIFNFLAAAFFLWYPIKSFSSSEDFPNRSQAIQQDNIAVPLPASGFSPGAFLLLDQLYSQYAKILSA
jgi:hypothetical protein